MDNMALMEQPTTCSPDGTRLLSNEPLKTEMGERPHKGLEKTQGTKRKAQWYSVCFEMFLALLALGSALWTFLFVVVTYGFIIPQNDFCKFYYSAEAYWQGKDMYGWNPSITYTLHGYACLKGEDIPIDLLNLNPPHFHLILLPLALLPKKIDYIIWIYAVLI